MSAFKHSHRFDWEIIPVFHLLETCARQALHPMLRGIQVVVPCDAVKEF